MTQRTRRITPQAVAIACTFATLLGIGPVTAQALFPQPAPPALPEGPEVVASTVNSVEGTVRKVDHAGGRVDITEGLFGTLERTLEVTAETQIHVEGRRSRLSDIREGDRVKASYEDREGQSIAKAVNVTESRKGTGPSPAQ